MIGKIKNSYRRLMEGTVYVQSPLRAFELDERILNNKYGLEVKELDYNSQQDMDLWCSLINNSYDEFSFTKEKAVRFLMNHPYMTNNQTFMFVREDPVATVSIGLYKKNPKIGGAFKLGVSKDYQGRGYGRLCLLYAFSKLNSMGITHGESAIRIKRVKSLFIHFALGFRPQFDMRFIASDVSRPSLKNLNIPFRLRIKKIYKQFLIMEQMKYK